MTFGERLKSLRKKNRWTQDDLANRLEVTKQAISGWERNASAPSSKQLIQLADTFDVSLDFLLGRTYASIKQERSEEGLSISSFNQNASSVAYDLEQFFNQERIQFEDKLLSSRDKSFALEVLRAFKNHTVDLNLENS